MTTWLLGKLSGDPLPKDLVTLSCLPGMYQYWESQKESTCLAKTTLCVHTTLAWSVLLMVEMCLKYKFPYFSQWPNFQASLFRISNLRPTIGSQLALVVKNPLANSGDIKDMGLIPGSGRSPGRGHGNPLQDSCLEYFMDRGAGQALVHRIAKSQTWPKWLSMHTRPATDCFLHRNQMY